MNIHLITGLAIATLTISGCATSVLTLNTTPSSAVVRAKSLGGGDWKTLGETPLTVSGIYFRTPGGLGSGPLLIEFSKDGYQSYRTVITEPATVDMTLNLDLEARSDSGISPDRFNVLLDRLFESQKLAQSGRYEDAIVKLRALEQADPEIAAIYELEGGIYYLQSRYREALDAYNLAVKLNPANPEAHKMRKLLEDALLKASPRSGPKPASEPPSGGSSR